LYTKLWKHCLSVILKPGEADRIVAATRGFYHAKSCGSPPPSRTATWCRSKTIASACWGTGFFNSKSKINVRLSGRIASTVDTDFFEERILEALRCGKKHLPGATSFRVVNAESDFLSGLIVDRYEDVLVVQISALGMDQRKNLIVAALQKIFSPRAILERSDCVIAQI